ncbi:MAG: hypothetical protein RLZZ321_227 [Bacteroidota bacterium]
MKNLILSFFLLLTLATFGQKEMFFPKLQRTFEFYLREAGQQTTQFQLRFFWPDQQLFPNCETWGSDGFGVICDQRQIQIFAYSEAACKNAVYDVLQRKFGFEYYQAECTKLPGRLPVKFAYDRYESVPAFEYREIFYGETRRTGYGDWHKLTSGESSFTFENHPGWGLWVHTLHKLLPPEQHFEAHPEYYALRNGIRMKDQVCLSNPDVLNLVCDNLAIEISKKPDAKYWSVSQMDNYNFCECDACKHTDSIEHSHAGTMLRFVNEVAKRFPNKIISTLAYQYTRSAPILTKPEANVNIMLCTIEENRAKSLKGSSFEKDLKNWAALTQNILIWDYVINFSHMVMPFPNWPTLQENIQIFQQNGVKMLFEQGYNSPSSEMQPLRAFLLSKWAWDPKLNADSLIYEFTENYYGPAGMIVREVLRAQVKDLQESCKALTLYEPPITHIGGYLAPANLKWALSMYEKAKSLPEMQATHIQRIEMAEQSIRYALLEVSKSPSAGSDWYFSGNSAYYQQMLKDFTRIALNYGPKLLHEVRLSPSDYEKSTQQFWKEAMVNHLAKNQQIKYHTLPAKAYSDGLQLEDTITYTFSSSLNDGLRATQEYQKSWQGWQGQDAKFQLVLKKPYVIDSVRIHYLANNQSWIMGPSFLKAFGQTSDQQSFTDSTLNALVNQAQPNGSYPLTLTHFPNSSIQTLEITIGNPGQLPKWRGVDGLGWLFIDEIEVYGHEK